jgi:hypothetical protein
LSSSPIAFHSKGNLPVSLLGGRPGGKRASPFPWKLCELCGTAAEFLTAADDELLFPGDPSATPVARPRDWAVRAAHESVFG